MFKAGDSSPYNYIVPGQTYPAIYLLAVKSFYCFGAWFSGYQDQTNCYDWQICKLDLLTLGSNMVVLLLLHVQRRLRVRPQRVLPADSLYND